MEGQSEENVTQLLKAWSEGDQSARDQLWAIVYPSLRRIAGAHMWHERANHTLQPTALIHEAYIRLAGQSSGDWDSRVPFFKLASNVMRHVLVDYARERAARKRGGGWDNLTLDEAIARGEERDIDLITLDEALAKYETVDPEMCTLVELRYYGGFSTDEIAMMFKVSESTVKRDLRTALAWLRSEMN
jgi:RNA polymerase sigma-70 factor, ECF subfamily